MTQESFFLNLLRPLVIKITSMNLFKKIVQKNIKKAKTEKDISRISDDVGPIKGFFKWKKIDPVTGQVFTESEWNNAVTYLGKSTIIRLLAQGQSQWANLISPDDARSRRVSRMRFGNAPAPSYFSNGSFQSLHGVTLDSSTVSASPFDIPLHYYDISEIAYRNNMTRAMNTTQAARAGAGGKMSVLDNGQIQSQSGSQVNQTINIVSGSTIDSALQSATGLVISLNQSPFPALIGGRPPSHKSFVVELHKANATVPYNFAVFVHTLGYNRRSGAQNTITSEYTKDPTTSDPATVVTPGSEVFNTDPSTGTILYYDYNDNQWKIKIVLNNPGVTGALFTGGSIKIKFNVGQWNIINSIVPKLGHNAGYGVDVTTRYGGNLDFYSIQSSNVQFFDSDTGFIDDFGVSFGITMNGPDGNGQSPDLAGYPVIYTEAFLMNEHNEIFSMVQLDDPIANPSATNPGFIKDKTLAYYLVWSLKVVV